MWLSQSEITFTVNQIPFLIEHLYESLDGIWTHDPHENIKTKSQTLSGAYYEKAIEIGVIIKSRIDKCGLDGQICKAHYIWGESFEDLSRVYGLPVREVERRCSAVVWYCSGQEDKKEYRRWVAYRALRKGVE